MATWWDLGYKSYDAYQKSAHWCKLVDVCIYKNPKAKCWICDRVSHLLLHHENYEHMGDERLYKDVLIVCWWCHVRIHFYLVIGMVRLFKVNLSEKILRKRRLFLKGIYCIQKFRIIHAIWFFWKGTFL